MKYERKDPVTGEMYTWVQGESLAELARPERVARIKADYEKRRASESSVVKEASLLSVFEMQCIDEHAGCVICHL